jgi:hypothetical protein
MTVAGAECAQAQSVTDMGIGSIALLGSVVFISEIVGHIADRLLNR